MKVLIAAITVVMLAGCGQQFRYPCQNPANWDQPECKRPICEVNRDCPDHIFKEDKDIKLPAAASVPPAPRGECR